MTTSFPMNGGDGPYRLYSKNFQLAKDILNGSKEVARDPIIQNLDIKIMLSPSSNTIRIEDFVCSVGPNTFIAMQHVVHVLKEKYHNNILEFQVFFNDHVTNDFNNLFQSLPIDRSYYAFGVPGSFYDRLFPSRSIHFAYSCCSIHWLSKCPEELLNEKSPAWNKGLIHYMASNNEVVNAYVTQFEKDMEMLLNARAAEIVEGGMMRKLDESLIDSFNLPVYFSSPEDMTKVVEKNNYFSIEKMKLTYPKSKIIIADAKILIINLKAVLEGLFINHFGRKL
ncbi:loganic acid O-methyltransferase-like [Capsicum annuum]|uniref:loganic acid O-methyltransferase-like n=1 Tax=Capsicum annuum TaxID=4072 RepID=UPI0007BF90DF|nr:loganic acid O-methyltransferase-like [Capsicum annuum]